MAGVAASLSFGGALYLSVETLKIAAIRHYHVNVRPSMQVFRLLLVDDHTLFRESLGRLLSSEPDLEILGQCSRGADALALLTSDPPDLVLLDFHLPDSDGAKFVQSAREGGYAGKILIVTGGIDAQASTEVLRLGISGVFLKHNPAESLLRAIRLALAGDPLTGYIFNDAARGEIPLNSAARASA